MKNLKKQLRKKLQNSEGFTLLEILVVLTIMGFLIAMVAPRLAGISGGAVDTVCDSNQNRMLTYMGTYFEKTSRFPNKLTNLVITDGAAGTDPEDAVYQIPVVSDQDPENGPEVFANEFYSRNHFHVHYLNADEAAELKNMGIVSLFNLNDYSQIDDAVANPLDYDNDVAHVAVANQRASMEPVTVSGGVAGADAIGVAMVGMGDNVGDGNGWVATNATERGWGEPDWFGRIVVGMGAESGLITSGVIGNAAHCPGGLQNADNATYNDYNLVLPRLEATVAKYDAAVVGAMDNDAATDGIQLVSVAYDDEPAAPYDVGANGDNLRVRTFDIEEVQESWQYATQCPEGHMYPEDDGEFWGINLDADAGPAYTID